LPKAAANARIADRAASFFTFVKSLLSLKTQGTACTEGNPVLLLVSSPVVCLLIGSMVIHGVSSGFTYYVYGFGEKEFSQTIRMKFSSPTGSGFFCFS
jgi:hypothetical protein